MIHKAFWLTVERAPSRWPRRRLRARRFVRGFVWRSPLAPSAVASQTMGWPIRLGLAYHAS